MIPTVHSARAPAVLRRGVREDSTRAGRASAGCTCIKGTDWHRTRDGCRWLSGPVPAKDAEHDQAPQVAAALAKRRLALAGVALAEVKPDLAHRQPWPREQDLEQDLEPAGAHGGHVDRRAA